MHQPRDTPRSSLYFHYRVHPVGRLAAAAETAGVVVVGAGPIGLMLALELARQGVPVVVLTAERQVCEGSRALCYTRRSMEILQGVGADRAIAAHGLPWRFGNSHYRGQRVYRMEAPHDENDRFWPLINLQQQHLEQALLDQVALQPRIELRWGHKVTAVQDSGERVQLGVDTPDGGYTQAAHWVVACDGARSTLRELQGLRLEGDSYHGRFVIADIRIDLPLPTERLAFFDPEWNPGNTMLMHREPHGLWRVDYQLPAGESPEQALRPEALKARIDAQLASIGHGHLTWEMDWCSVYSARAMTLPNFVNRRVVYCGDAAHMLPIFGVRGANTGFQDAQNLAWKLAANIRGIAGPNLLASYSHERVAAAREIVAEAGKSTRFMAPPSRGFRLLRDASLSLAVQHEFVRPLMHWRTSRPHDYLDSPLNCPSDDSALFSTGPAPGAPLANVRLGDDHHLLDESPAGFWLLVFQNDETVSADVTEVVAAWRARGVALSVLTIGPHAALSQGASRMWARYGVLHAGAAVLARPDQHVCARWLRLDGPRLDAAMRRAMGQ